VVELIQTVTKDSIVYCTKRLLGHFADKPTSGQSGHGLFNSPTSQLADSKFFLNHENTIIYFYNKQKRSTNPNPVDYGKCSVV